MSLTAVDTPSHPGKSSLLRLAYSKLFVKEHTGDRLKPQHLPQLSTKLSLLETQRMGALEEQNFK